MTVRAPPARLLALLCAVAAIAVFSVAASGDFVWDDIFLLAKNPQLHGPGYWRHALGSHFFDIDPEADRPINSGIFRPVVSLAYRAEYSLWGANPTAFHLASLGLHAACVVLVFFWLQRRLSGVASASAAAIASAAGALVFALHPSRAESVAWISGCTDLWMTLWTLVALTAWDLFSGVAGSIVCGLAFALALLSKEVSVAAPLALLVDALLRSSRNGARRWLPVFALPGGALVLRLWLVPIGGSVHGSASPSAVVYRVIATLGGYVRLALWPWPASTQTGYLSSAFHAGTVVPPASSFVIGLGVTAALLTGVVVARRRPEFRPWLADTAWFVLPLAPLLNIVMVSPVYYLAERHLYLAGIGLAALAGRAATVILGLRAPIRQVLLAGGGAWVIALAAGSVAHARHFISSDALWTYETTRDPRNVIALENMFQVRFDERRFGAAKALAAQAVAATGTPENKAIELNHWLDADFQEGMADDTHMVEVKEVHDRIAAATTPPGVAAELYSAIALPGQIWLRRFAPFRRRRAAAAAAVGDFASAARQLQALEHDAGVSERVSHPLIIDLIAAGSMSEAHDELDRIRTSDAELMKLGHLWSTVTDLRARALPASFSTAMVSALVEAGEWPAAHVFMRRVLDSAPATASALRDNLSIDAALHRYAAVRADVAQLRVVAPEGAHDYDDLIRALPPDQPL